MFCLYYSVENLLTTLPSLDSRRLLSQNTLSSVPLLKRSGLTLRKTTKIEKDSKKVCKELIWTDFVRRSSDLRNRNKEGNEKLCLGTTDFGSHFCFIE